jgi:hypothetical protein
LINVCDYFDYDYCYYSGGGFDSGNGEDDGHDRLHTLIA